MRQLPNILTVARIILTAFFVFLINQGGFVSTSIAAAVFLFASLTDYYDGYFAKKKNLVTNFGKIMDPIADKLLILAAFFVFLRMDIIAGWMFVLIFLRETLVTGSRLLAIRKGKVLAAEKAGKFKTVSQIIVISFILMFVILRESSLSRTWGESVFFGWHAVITLLMLVTIALTIFSGISYFRGYRKFVYV